MSGLRAANLLSPADEETIRANVTRETIGGERMLGGRIGMRRFNHAICGANLCDIVARLWPDAPDAPRFRDEAEAVWGEWLRFGDNMEVAANYEAFAQADILLWAERRGERDTFLADPGTRHWIDRGLEHVLPGGYIPGYGDTCTMELWSDWFEFLALVAAWTEGERARRARWAVERMFGWVRERNWIRNLTIMAEVPEDPYRAKQAWGQIPRTAWRLAMAREVLIPRMASLVPQPPPVRPVVTLRRMDSHELPWNNSWSLMPSEPGPVIQDKLVLRLGQEPESPAAMIGCARQIWHDHLDAGAVLAFTADNGVHVDDSGYMQRYPTFHNLFWAQDAGRPWLGYSLPDYVEQWPNDFTVRGLTGGDIAQMATLICVGPHRMPVEQVRTVLLTRAGALIVHDRVVPFAENLVGAQLWHVQAVRSSGPGWAETSMDEFRGMNGPWFPDVPGRMVVASPYDAVRPRVDVQENLDPYASPHYVEPVTRYFVYWKASFVSRSCVAFPRPLTKGQAESFLSVLVPASRTATAPANAVRLAARNERHTIVEAAGGVFVWNEGTETIATERIETDAKVLWTEPGGIFAHRAKRVTLRMPGEPKLVIETGAGAADFDLHYDGASVRGTISIERAADVRIVLGGRERRVRARGITPVDESF